MLILLTLARMASLAPLLSEQVHLPLHCKEKSGAMYLLLPFTFLPFIIQGTVLRDVRRKYLGILNNDQQMALIEVPSLVSFIFWPQDYATFVTSTIREHNKILYEPTLLYRPWHGPSEGWNYTVNKFVYFSCQNTVVQFNQKLHAVICSGPCVGSKQSLLPTRCIK